MPEERDLLESLISELRRGTVVLAVLSLLRTPMYGYALVQTLAGQGMEVEANTLYPLLRRLETQGLLHSEWETEGSKPRKYYEITGLGISVYEKLVAEWNKTVHSVRDLVGEE